MSNAIARAREWKKRLKGSRARGRELSRQLVDATIPIVAKYTNRSEKEIRELVFAGIVPADLAPKDDDST